MLNRLQFEAQRQLYKWDRYVPTTFYRWDKYEAIEHPHYRWRRWNTASTAPLSYTWRKYNAMQSETYYSWNKREETYQVKYGWRVYENNPQSQMTITRVGTLDEYNVGGDRVEVFAQPTTTSTSRVLYYGDDYWYDWEDVSGYVQYNGRWLEANAVRNGGSGTQIEGWEITIVEEIVPGKGNEISSSPVYSDNAGAHQPGLNADGYFYESMPALTTNYYSSSVSSTGTPVDIVYTSSLPELDKWTGRYKIVDTTAIDYPRYGYVRGNDEVYYVFPTEGKCFVVNRSVFTTTATHITSYAGIAGMNAGDYYQIPTGEVNVIKGSETSDSPVSSPNPQAYTEGLNADGFFYEFIGTSEGNSYIWDSFSVAHTEITKYIWEQYNPLYTWNKYTYTTKKTFTTSGGTRIPLFEYSFSSSAITSGRPRFRIGDSGYINAPFMVARASRSQLLETTSIPYEGTVGFIGDSTMTVRMITEGILATNQIITNIQTTWSSIAGKGTVYAYIQEEPERGTFIGTESSTNEKAHSEGVEGGVWYEKATPFRSRGSLIDQKSSLSPDAYPHNDWGEDGFYYLDKPPVVETEDTAGDFVGEVSADSINAYPYPEGIRNNVYYRFSRVEVADRVKTQEIEPIESSEMIYVDGYQPNDPLYIWYEFAGNFPTYSRGEYIKVEESTDEGAHDPGYSDGYWWEYAEDRVRYGKGEYIDYIEDYYRNKYVDDGEQNGTWYVFAGGRSISIPDVPNSEIFGGITINQQTNANGDLQFGMTAGSSITFTVDNYDSRADAYLEAKVYHQMCFNDEIVGDDLDDPSMYKQVGVYYIKEVVKKRQKATITAYDSLYLLDQNADDFMMGEIGVSFRQLIEDIARKVGASISTIEGVNLNVQINKENMPEKNNTYRQIMSWALEAINSFLVADAIGAWCVRSYVDTGVILTDNDYYDLQISDYPIPKPTRVVENTYGRSAGNGDNLYLINNNGLIGGNAQTIVNGIKDNLATLPDYYTASFKLYSDKAQVGDIIYILSYGVQHRIYVMSRMVDASGIYIECFGNSRRQAVFDPTTVKINQVRTVAETAQQNAEVAYQKAEEVQDNVTQQGFRINELEGTISGAVKFEDLAGTGRQTVIDGDLIKTGTIDARHISTDILSVATHGAILGYNGSTNIDQTSGIQMTTYMGRAHVGGDHLYSCVASSTGGAKLEVLGQTSGHWFQIFTNQDRAQMQNYDNQYIGVDAAKCYASESLTIVSDREKKTDIEDLEYEEVFKRLRPRRYKMKDGASGRYHTGFVAQEVKDAVIDAGLTTDDLATYVEYEDQDGTQTCGLRYEELIALNTMMIQKQAKEIEELKAEIEKLKGETK